MGHQRRYAPIGRNVPEPVDAIERNGWPQWIGIDGRHPVERVEPFNRNRWPESAECAMVVAICCVAELACSEADESCRLAEASSLALPAILPTASLRPSVILEKAAPVS